MRRVRARLAAGLLALLAGCAVQSRQTAAGRHDEPGEAVPEVRRIEVSPGVALDRACTTTGPELCFNARDDNCNGIVDEGCGLQTGLVQFVIAWRDDAADVDLEVTDPKGELVEVGQENEAGFIKDRDCPGNGSDCHGQNYENVFLAEGREPPRGAYRVRIRLERLGTEEPPVEVNLGARLGPRSYAARLGLERTEDVAEVLLEL